METVKDWNRALLYTGQGVKPDDIKKYAGQLRDVDPTLFEQNIEAAEKASDLHLARYMVDPEDIFNDNAALQMTVHTLNVTAGDLALRKIGTTEGLVAAGHSLGEVAAFDDVFPSRDQSMEFVFNRGTVMQKAYAAYPSSSYLIMGLSSEQLDPKTRGWDVHSSLFNGPQLTVVGSYQGRTDLEELAKAAGAKKVIDLKIPAFHTYFMANAMTEMAAFNMDREYKDSRYPVFSNLSPAARRAGGVLVNNHISSFINPVRWVETTAAMNHDDMVFYCLGPGDNPANLNKNNEIPKERTKDLFQLLAE